MTYDLSFYEAETRVAVRSASVVLPDYVTPGDWVADIGCGTGGWAYIASELGAVVFAVDLDVPKNLQLVPVCDHDLSLGYDCTGYDLAICLEVAEHLPDHAAIPLVEGLVGATRVLFSAATPGQPGVGHINCRPHDYWHGLFDDYGFQPTHIGPKYGPPVEDFYCRNLFVYDKKAE